MTGLLADLERAMQQLRDAPCQPTPSPLVSPRCGLDRQHGACRSAICECRCHWPTT